MYALSHIVTLYSYWHKKKQVKKREKKKRVKKKREKKKKKRETSNKVPYRIGSASSMKIK